MCGERGRKIRSERQGGDWGGKTSREGDTLLPNEGSALVELKMDMKHGVTKTGVLNFLSGFVVLTLLAREVIRV